MELLSRVADAVYWMARYIERAENVARYIGVNLNLQLDLPGDPSQHWQSLIDTSGDTEAFKERYGLATQHNVIGFLTFDAGNPNSIFSCLRAARENARSIRETISSAMWEQVNEMYLQISARQLPGPERLPEFYRQLRLASHLFQGVTDATMSHNEAWHFARLGRKLERADKTSRILDVKYFMLLPSLSDVGTPYDDIHWSAVLKSVSGLEMYRRKHGRLHHQHIVEFLVMDREFPRAVHYCVTRAETSLRAITGSVPGVFRYASEVRMGRLRSDLDFTPVSQILASGLHGYLDALQMRINEIDNALYADFIDRPPEGAPVDSPFQYQSQRSASGSA
ncbi:MAG TPA: alpha-E domain-containing protein [Bryobacteraceae bacterium]|nr:alpha-E domain-containing protein [Bryobacteraceae bacterium]